jgi:hypothetical protein
VRVRQAELEARHSQARAWERENSAFVSFKEVSISIFTGKDIFMICSDIFSYFNCF